MDHKSATTLYRAPWLYVAIAFSGVLVAACLRQPDHTVHPSNFSFPVDPAFTGMLKVAVDSWAGQTMFVMDLQSGRGDPSANLEMARKPYCGSMERGAPMRTLRSPNGLSSILCPLTDTLVIRGQHGEQIRVQAFPEPIRDVAWSPDSTSMAVLVEQSKAEFFSRQGLLALIHSLHPIPLVRYRLFLYSPESDTVEELPLPADYIQGGWAAVEWGAS